MTTSMEIQLTAGQKCLIDLLQRKLLNTIQSYRLIKLEKQQQQQQQQESSNKDLNIDEELLRLKEKIRRISARQKRFTIEIINKNSTNTIPKESFFEALGLVTKEALSKLNSKTNERRRRTTANPRFSHEAIQAKRAAMEQPNTLQQRRSLESRLKDRQENNNRQENTKRESARRQQQNVANNHHAPKRSASSNQVNEINGKNVSNNRNQQLTSGANSNGSNNIKTSGRSNSRNSVRNTTTNNGSNRDLLARLEEQIYLKVNQIEDKRDDNRKLEVQNELIRKRGLDIITALRDELTKQTSAASAIFQSSGIDCHISGQAKGFVNTTIE